MKPLSAHALGACALALCTLVPGAAAHAHGGIWRANQILVAPDDPGRIVLQSSLRGPIFSSDAGARWQWMCAETYGQSSLSASPVAMLLRPNGRVLVAGYTRGLLISDDAFCSFRAPEGPALSWTRDLAVDAEGIVALASTEVGDNVQDVLLRSRDEGARFEVLGAPLPGDFIARGVDASHGAAPRLYVTGLRDDGWALAHSDDGAVTWTFGAVVPFNVRVGWNPTLVGVGRDDPSLVFVLRDENELSVDESQDALFVSTDGGASFRVLYADGRALRGFAQSPDGKSLLLAGESGLFHAPVSDALARGKGAFTQRVSTPFYGLSWTHAGVHAGMEEFSVTSPDAYSVGLSTDEGRTFARRMAICETRAATCATETDGATLCPEVFSDLGRTGGGFKEDFLDGNRCAPP
ncbi:MAG: sialidase family protein [Polyangiales bacterium]